MKSPKPKRKNPEDELPKKMKPGTCLDLINGREGQSSDGQFCVKIQSFQRKDLATRFSEVTEKEKFDQQIPADCYGSTTVKNTR